MVEVERRNNITERPEALNQHYRVLVIDPYSINIKDIGPSKGDVRLSFYSAFVNHVGREIIEDGLVDEVLGVDDASFGLEHATTGDETYKYFTSSRPHKDKPYGPIMPRDKVKIFEGSNLARTPTQVREVARYLKERGRNGEKVLYLGLDYHRTRVRNHSIGFGLNTEYISAEEAHAYYEPRFDLERFMEILPMDEIENMESFRRLLSYIDTPGYVPAIVQNIKNLKGDEGPHMLDNRRGEDGKLHFDYRPGVDRLRELDLI